MANLPRGVNHTGGKFSTNINYTGGKFATGTTGVVDISVLLGKKLPTKNYLLKRVSKYVLRNLLVLNM